MRNISTRSLQASAAIYAPPGNSSNPFRTTHEPAPTQLVPQQTQQTNNNNNTTNSNINNNNNPLYPQQQPVQYNANNNNFPTVVSVQGPTADEIALLTELNLQSVIAFKFRIDRAKEKHKSSKIGYASYINEPTTLKLQTFASCCPSIAKSNYPGSQYATCVDLSTHA